MDTQGPLPPLINPRNQRRARREQIARWMRAANKLAARKPRRRALRLALELARAVFHRREMPARFADSRLAAAYAAELEGLRRGRHAKR